jgi:hypothetical protein
MSLNDQHSGEPPGNDRHAWADEFPGSTITVCDKDGRIIALNGDARRSFAEQGGGRLIGSNIFDCHPEPARTKFRALMDSRRQNIYTIQKGGRRKLVFQTPWFIHGEFAGYLDLTLEIPWDMPHFNRDQEQAPPSGTQPGSTT